MFYILYLRGKLYLLTVENHTLSSLLLKIIALVILKWTNPTLLSSKKTIFNLSTIFKIFLEEKSTKTCINFLKETMI